MTTVPKAGDGAPANNAKTLLLQSDPNMYVRPTAGGNASGTVSSAPGSAPGVGGPGAPAGVIPSNPIMGAIENQPPAGSLLQAYNSAAYQEANAGADASTGGTQAGPDMGHGATIVVPMSGDRPSGGEQAYTDSAPGTVGPSGPQQL